MGFAQRIHDLFDDDYDEDYDYDEPIEQREPDVFHEPFKAEEAPASQVAFSQPTRFEEACEIADHLLAGHTVMLNMEKTPPATANRLLDFLSGVAYAKEGQIKRVAIDTYLILPYNATFSEGQIY